MKKRKEVLVIVAHPDDEIIWMGGTLLKNKKNWNTTIISLCRKDDKERAVKFKKICKILKVKSLMSNLEDETLEDIPLNEVIKRIKLLIHKNKEYDYIFTHGKNGEYGHKRHIDVHKAVIKIINDKILLGKKIFFFSYLKKKHFCYPNKNSDKFIKLNALELLKKKELIQNIYGFKKNSFEEKNCKKIESFRVKEI